MGELNLNGYKFTGEHFVFEGGVVYIDGHAVMDYNEERIRIDGHCDLVTDKNVTFRKDVTGCTIKAAKVIVNGEMKDCKIEADMIVDNRD